MKKRLLVALLVSLMAPVLVGCGPRRTTTVDPLPDPVFRDISGTPGYRRQSPTARSGPRVSQSAGGPWAVRNLSSRWKYIIVHHSATQAGGAERFDRTHRRPKYLGGNGMDELGYHFVIGNGTDTPDGKIEVGSRWLQQKHGAHCRVSPGDNNEYNKHGIGICLVGNFEQTRPSAAQMKSLTYLTNGLLRNTHLPASAVHYHSDFKSTKCPGRYFPYSTYKRALRR